MRIGRKHQILSSNLGFALWVTLTGLWMAQPSFGGESGSEPSVPSFKHDILPILSKAGCNGGGCHGALAGKGGFRLSLLAYDADADYLTITREALGRRIELTQPGASLLLTKPTTAVPHKGGKRLETGSGDYQTLAQWIAAGAPGPDPKEPELTRVWTEPAEWTLDVGESRRLTVWAEYADGRKKEVTDWARFTSTDETIATVDDHGEVTVIGHGLGAVTAWYSSQVVLSQLTVPHPQEIPEAVFAEAPRANFIDDLVLDQLRRLRLEPSPRADDPTLLRRLYLDTLGRLPTPQEARAFTSDPDPDKWVRWVDAQFARSEFIDFWAYKWSDLLLVNGSKLRPKAVQSYYYWVREQVAANTPWNELVQRLVTASGSSVENGASNFFAVHQDPESMAENVSQAFLSLSINCARCHNHPLEKWTNDQYYAFANLFARVRAKGWGGDARSGDGVRTLFVEPKGDLIQPNTGQPQPPAPLDARSIPMDDQADRRVVLAEWLTSAENPYFTRAIVNRIWAHYLGLGLVEPVDDLRVSNPASNPALLDALSDFLVAQGFDLRALMRTILLSETYRRSSEVIPRNEADSKYHARYYPRRLMAEVLSDAITDVTGVADNFSEIALNDGSSEITAFYQAGTRAVQLYDSAVRSYFLKTFGRNEREITCECERSNQPSLVQVLHLANGGTINEKLAAEESRVTQLLREYPEPAPFLEEAWWWCLGRSPTDRERAPFLQAWEEATLENRREVAEDVFWALLSSREFLFQR